MLEFGSATFRVSIAPSFWVFAIVLTTFYSFPPLSSLPEFLLFIFALTLLICLQECTKVLCYRVFFRKRQKLDGNVLYAIQLNLFGGSTTFTQMDQVVSKRGQLFVHCMGLLVMLLLVPPLFYCIFYIQFLNAFWGILLLMDLIWIRLNLLPILPFVGGRVGAALLHWLFPTFGDRISCLLSTATALLIAGYFFLYYNSWILGGYFVLLAWNSLQVSKLPREEVLDQTEYDQALRGIETAIQNARYDSALEMIRLIKQKLHEEESVSFSLLEQLTCKEAKILLLQQKPREAFEAISAAEEAGVKITMPELLMHKQLAAYKTSHFEESLEAGQAAFRKRPEAATALLLALTGGRLGRSAVVVAWLLAAKSLGVTDFTALEQLADFDAVRHEPEVQLLFKKSCHNL